MRMMYVLPAEAFGGAERQGVLHIRKLAELGIELSAVVGPGEPVQQALRSYGISDYHYCGDFPGRTHSRMRLVGNLRHAMHYARCFFRASERLVAVGRAADVQAIFAARSFGWAVAARAASILRVPYIVRAGSRANHQALLLAIRSMRARYGRPAALLSNCRAVESSLIDAFDCPGSIVPNGVDTTRFDPDRVQAHLRTQLAVDDRPVIGLAARPAPEKGMDVFAATVQEVLTAVPNAIFLIAGEFGWRSHYERCFAALGLSEQVRFLGHVGSMPEFFASCDVIVLTSPERSIEGSPNSILEAMSMRRPVVASRVAGIPEIVRDGIEGHLVAPDDARGFATSIVAILQRPSWGVQMGRAGRQRVIACYSESVAIDALEKALCAISQSRGVASQAPQGA